MQRLWRDANGAAEALLSSHTPVILSEAQRGLCLC
jgi:hypothetical protein